MLIANANFYCLFLAFRGAITVPKQSQAVASRDHEGFSGGAGGGLGSAASAWRSLWW